MDMKRLWRACLVLMAAVCIGLGGQGPAEAAPQVIEATGVYIMGDNDSPKIARDAARQVTEALARTRELGWEELAVE